MQQKNLVEEPLGCYYCYPEVTNHAQEKFNSVLIAYINRPFSFVINLLTLYKLRNFTYNYLTCTIRALLKLDKIKQHDEINRNQSVNRIKLLWDEAKTRGLKLYSFSMGQQQLLSFLLKYNGKNYYFHYSPMTLLHKHFNNKFKDPAIYDDKFLFKKLLIKNQFPHPQGKLFVSKRRALNYGKKLGFPLVVKPAASSLSNHVVLNISNESALINAINTAKIIDMRIIVEEFINGEVHRVICLNNTILVCSKRQQASITGDGLSTINELMEQFNTNLSRKIIEPIGAELYKKTQTNKYFINYFKKQGVNLNTVLAYGQKIYLSDKTTGRHAAEVINVTEHICADNSQLFLKLHNTLGVAMSAVDVICENIAQPWHKQSFAILENNSTPAIEVHHYPLDGEPINVAKAIWDFVLHNLDYA